MSNVSTSIFREARASLPSFRQPRHVVRWSSPWQVSCSFQLACIVLPDGSFVFAKCVPVVTKALEELEFVRLGRLQGLAGGAARQVAEAGEEVACQARQKRL
jgi:hypothetical protein